MLTQPRKQDQGNDEYYNNVFVFIKVCTDQKESNYLRTLSESHITHVNPWKLLTTCYSLNINDQVFLVRSWQMGCWVSTQAHLSLKPSSSLMSCQLLLFLLRCRFQKTICSLSSKWLLSFTGWPPLTRTGAPANRCMKGVKEGARRGPTFAVTNLRAVATGYLKRLTRCCS